MHVIIKIIYTHNVKPILRKFAVLKNSVRGPHVARKPIVGPHCLKP